MDNMVVLSALAGLATALGAGLVMLWGRPSEGLMAFMLGLAGGIMLAVACFDLFPEALILGGPGRAVAGLFWGALLMQLLGLVIGGLRTIGSGPKAEYLRAGWLILLGIAFHNLAEGVAIGAGLVVGPGLGLAIVIAIAIHNVPEGMAVAIPLRMGGLRRFRVVAFTAIAGLVTALGTWLGALIFWRNHYLVSAALGLAGGAMIFIVADELIPGAREKHRHWGNLGLVLGLAVGLFI